MKNWNFASRSGFYHIDDGIIREDVLAGLPLIIDPSITFRKHFELPTQVDRDPNTLKLELFARFLPADIDKYICQFVPGPETEEGTQKILGLAIQENDLRWLEGIHGENNEKYFLERMISPPSDESNCVFELELSEGIFTGVFQEGFLDWSRYLKSPDGDERKQTRKYLENEYSHVQPHRESPPFSIETGEEWTSFLDSWLPDQPDSEMRVTRESNLDFWSRWQTTAWTLLVLGVLTVGTWWSYNYYTLLQNQQWLQEQASRFLTESEDPLNHLNSVIEKRKNTLQTTDETLDVYPRVADVDEALAQVNVELLQLKISDRQGQVSFLTNSLSTAENLNKLLREQKGITRTEIVSTNPREDSSYQFKVDINLLWNIETTGVEN